MVPRRIIVFWSLGICQSTSLKPRTVITVWWATGTPLCALENHESGDEAQDVCLPFGRTSVVNLNRGPCVLVFFSGPPCVFLTSCPGWVECHLLSWWRQEHPPGVQNRPRASTLRRHRYSNSEQVGYQHVFDWEKYSNVLKVAAGWEWMNRKLESLTDLSRDIRSSV